MTVEELRAHLALLPGDAEVVIVTSAGAEPNASPLEDVNVRRYLAETTWSGNVKHPEDEPDPQDVQAVVLWPVR